MPTARNGVEEKQRKNEETTPDVVVDPNENLTIYGKLVLAQQEIGNVAKNAINEFFKNPKGKPSKFVDLAALNEAVIPVLNKHGLFLSQRVDILPEAKACLVTQIYDQEGNSFSPSYYPIVAKDLTDPQKFGAGVTYARRYALMAYLGIAPEDDDGNLAATPKPNPAVELANALKGAGIDSQDKLAKAIGERFNDKRSKLSELKTVEMQAWADDLKNNKEQVPF